MSEEGRGCGGMGREEVESTEGKGLAIHSKGAADEGIVTEPVQKTKRSHTIP